MVQKCRVYKVEDGTYEVFNPIGIGYGNTRAGAYKCWDPDHDLITRLIRSLVAEAKPLFDAAGV